MQSTERKPTGLERMALSMLENLLRSSLGKSPDELRAVFDVTLANLNAAAGAIVTINQRLALIETCLGLRLPETAGEHPRHVADATVGRLANGDGRPSTLHPPVADQPGGNGVAAGGAGGTGSEDGGAA